MDRNLINFSLYLALFCDSKVPHDKDHHSLLMTGLCGHRPVKMSVIITVQSNNRHKSMRTGSENKGGRRPVVMTHVYLKVT